MEKILMIREVDYSPTGYDGYEVITDKQTIEVKIDNASNCCEVWGCFSTNDNLSDFIDAELLDIYVTDEELKTSVYKARDVYIDEDNYPNAMLVTFNTNRGPFQLAVYNSHNGYYGHTAFIKSTQLNYSEVL